MSRLIVAAVLAIFAGTSAMAQEEKPAGTQGDTVEATDPEAAKIVADCNARKFETSVEIEKDGRKRQTRFKLCAATNSDDASWAKTLKDAKAKIAAHPDISEESKASIVAQLDAEIAKLTPHGSEPTPVESVLPPAAKPPAAPPIKPASTTAVSPGKPRLTIRCLAFGEAGEGSQCFSIERDMSLVIRADGDLAGGTSLRFLRRGDVKGEVALPATRQGQPIRYKLPQQICAGVSTSKLEIQVLSSNQVVDTHGPYLLRC